MNIGNFQVDFPLDGRFKLDGGAIFGVVPKALWKQQVPVDDQNRIPLAARPMLLRSADRTILVDTGIGTRWSDREKEIYDIQHDEADIRASLSERGVDRSDVTDVVFTHLHFDHAGATTFSNGGDVELTFPNATYHVQIENWKWASNPTERDAASYRKKDFERLENHQLRFLDGDTELVPGLFCEQVDGHTKGLQIIRVTDEDTKLIYVNDVIPTVAHLPLPYITGYDLWPLETLRQKKALYEEYQEKQTLFAFEHDPEVAVCTLREGDNDHPEIDQVIT